MLSTTSLSFSKKLQEVLGEFETERRWFEDSDREDDAYHFSLSEPHLFDSEVYRNCTIPAPTFSELIRLLPKLGERLGWGEKTIFYVVADSAIIYMDGNSTEEGMAQVEEYLEKLLK